MTTARDDYPYIAWHSMKAGADKDRQQLTTALDEIDSLRRWKQESLEVLASWEQVWIAAGSPGPLGSSKADSVRRVLENRQEVCGR
jgi:hypothetical protein